jgi:hypothetical protein
MKESDRKGIQLHCPREGDFHPLNIQGDEVPINGANHLAYLRRQELTQT